MRLDTILRKTRLRRYGLCLAMIEAYADLAPWWERWALVGYCGLGSWAAGHLGVDTAALWRKGEVIMADILAASGCSMPEIAALLRQLVQMRLNGSHALPFDEAKARIYDQFYYPVGAHMTFAMQASAGARLEFVLRAVAETGLERGAVADLGCGPGVMLSEILLSQPAWKGYGLDISQTTVGYAQRLAAHKGVAARAEISTGDVACLPYPAGSMDVVVASEVLEHVPDLPGALREITRVLRPGGRAAITLPLETRAATHIHSVNTPDGAMAQLEAAGLAVLSCEVRRERLRYGDDPVHLFLLAEARPARQEWFPGISLPAASRESFRPAPAG
jgi:SAM-dependent methyltransferase